jgi:N-methylhydantoinase A
VAFGGAGPMHAAALAEELGIAEVICPPIPGAFSALGLVGTDLKRDYVRTFYATTATADPRLLDAGFAELETTGAAMLDRAGISSERRRFIRSVDARYQRQSYELHVPVPDGRLEAAQMPAIAAAFHERHRQTYGHDNASEPVQIVNLRVAAVGTIPPLRIRQETAAEKGDARKGQRRMWFRSTGEVEVQVWDRARMAAQSGVAGPAVIESLESTILVPPAWLATMDRDGFVNLGQAKAQAPGMNT